MTDAQEYNSALFERNALNLRGCCQRGIPLFMFISPSDTKILIPAVKNPIFSMLGEQFYNSAIQGYKDMHMYDGDFIDVGSSPTGYGQYDALFKANPYRNLTYKKTAMQELASWLGFRTKADDFVEQARLNAQEYDAGIFSMMQQNEYNSPEQQAMRERAAGLNTDLLGLGDSVAAAHPTEDPNGMNVAPTDDTMPLKVIQSVGSSVLGLIPQAMSFITQFSQLKGIKAENDLKQLEFGTSAVDAATKFFAESITESDYRDAFESGNWDNILEASRKDSKYLADTFLSSKRARKAFNLAYGMHANSLKALAQKYGTYEEFEKNRYDVLRRRASPFFSDDNRVMEDLLSSVFGPYERWQKRLFEINEQIANLRSPELEQGLVNTQLSNQQLYENNIDPVAQAESENAANKLQEQQNKIMEATNQLFEDMMSNLQKNDNWWSKIAMALIGIARAQLLSGMSVQFGRRQQINSQTGQVEDLSNASVSF